MKIAKMLTSKEASVYLKLSEQYVRRLYNKGKLVGYRPNGGKIKSILLLKKMREVKSDNLPEYITVYVGNTRKAILGLDYGTQRKVKEHYMLCYHWLYDEIPIEQWN